MQMRLFLHGTEGRPAHGIDSVDILVFNDDRLQRLDSYQRIAVDGSGRANAASRSGKKIISVIANPHSDRYTWADVSSFAALCSKVADLRTESPERLLLSGYVHAEAGDGSEHEIALSPLASEIRLESLKTDFSSKPYRDEYLEDVKVYLTNVNTRARIFQQDGFMPESICNSGGLSQDDLGNFSHPEAIYREIGTRIGGVAVYPDISMICYPNECSEESAGSPFTRLVIEGKIAGRTCYYPININRSDSGEPGGIRRNSSYIFNVTLKTTGSSDPDIAVTPADIDISCDILPWEENDGNEIEF